MNRLTLLQELVKYQDLDITVCVLEYSGKTSILIKQLGVREISLNRKAKFIYLKTTLGLYKVLNSIKPDIIHTGNLDADIHGFLASSFISNSKLVVEEIGSSSDRKPIMRRIHRFIYERADMVLCVSPDILADMRKLEGLKRKDVHITYNPVNVSALSKSEISAFELRSQLAIDDNCFVFGIISRFELFKGHTYLFHAFKKLKDRYSNIKLLVVGSGPLLNDFNEEIKQLGISEDVIFPGMVSNVADYLNLMDVFVHPSLKEPFGISIIEAMYMGCPVISTNVGGPLDYIENGDTGVLVPPKDVDALYRSMEELMNSSIKRETLGKNARKLVQKRFLPEVYAENISSLYKSLVKSE